MGQEILHGGEGRRLEFETKVKQRFAKISQFTLMEKALSWFKVPTSTFTFKTL